MVGRQGEEEGEGEEERDKERKEENFRFQVVRTMAASR